MGELAPLAFFMSSSGLVSWLLLGQSLPALLWSWERSVWFPVSESTPPHREAHSPGRLAPSESRTQTLPPGLGLFSEVMFGRRSRLQGGKGVWLTPTQAAHSTAPWPNPCRETSLNFRSSKGCGSWLPQGHGAGGQSHMEGLRLGYPTLGEPCRW